MISVDELFSQLGQRSWPRVFDMRSDEEVEKTPRLLPAARRAPLASLVATAQEDTAASKAPVVVYCAKGGPRAESAAALLRAAGLPVASLEGGIAAWLEAKGPSVCAPRVAALAPARSRWVTRARPKIDRIACPWLIRRFIDAGAEIYFVAAPTVESCAALIGAEPFDIEGARFSHQGEACSFDSLLAHFDVRDEALMRLAPIVRGADTARLDLAPEAAGLLAMSLGLSAACASDDAMLEAGETLYDSLYAWARHASAERHNWPAAGR